MTKETSNFIKRIGSLIPGFSGYENDEQLRNTDYQIRLFTKSVIESYIYAIERSKNKLNNDDLMEIDELQNLLKLFCTKISNQKFGYIALFDRGEKNEKLLEELIKNDEKLINIVEKIEIESMDINYIKNIHLELEKILTTRKKILS